MYVSEALIGTLLDFAGRVRAFKIWSLKFFDAPVRKKTLTIESMRID